MGPFEAMLAWALLGMVLGVMARFLVPLNQPYGLVNCTLLGICGAVVGGLISFLFPHANDPVSAAGWLLALLGAIILLSLYLYGFNRWSNAPMGP